VITEPRLVSDVSRASHQSLGRHLTAQRDDQRRSSEDKDEGHEGTEGEDTDGDYEDDEEGDEDDEEDEEDEEDNEKGAEVSGCLLE